MVAAGVWRKGNLRESYHANASAFVATVRGKQKIVSILKQAR